MAILLAALNNIRTMYEKRDADFLHILFLVRHITQVCTKPNQEEKSPR